MKKYKQLLATLRAATQANQPVAEELVWQLICYLPKMPLRLPQQELLDAAETTMLRVHEPHFTDSILPVKTYRWGKGPLNVIITHGWASKAADFIELIQVLRQDERLSIFSFDAPEFESATAGKLSYMLLFINSVKAIIENFGSPAALIGHSLGAMANCIVLSEAVSKPVSVFSIAPIVRLKENFEDSMNSAGMSAHSQAYYFRTFREHFREEADFFRLSNLYKPRSPVKHWLAYDPEDKVSHVQFLDEFLQEHPEIERVQVEGVGHDRIIRSATVIEAIRSRISELQTPAF